LILDLCCRLLRATLAVRKGLLEYYFLLEIK
jgi:hypothetical protein